MKTVRRALDLENISFLITDDAVSCDKHIAWSLALLSNHHLRTQRNENHSDLQDSWAIYLELYLHCELSERSKEVRPALADGSNHYVSALWA